MAERLRELLADKRSAATVMKAMDYGDTLFDGPRAVGIDLARTALRGILPEETVSSTIEAYWRLLAATLR